MALATILMVYPFTKSKIELPVGVSQAFHDQFKIASNKEVLPVDPDLQPRKAPANAIPALAYSGGVDSTAALTLLPQHTCSIFVDRMIPPNNKTLYKKEAAYFACESLRKMGRHVYIVKTDFEYIRSPAGFAVEMSSAIPALLLSDYLSLDSIAMATTLEDNTFLEFPAFFAKRLYFTKWDNIFTTVDIPLNKVTWGISEVGNYTIVMKSPYHSFTQPCIRGNVHKPCMNCYKCFRKILLEMTLLKKEIDDQYLNRLFKIREARINLMKFPMANENVITYITAHYHGNHHLMNLLKKKTRGNLLKVSWMEQWYSPSREDLAPKYRNLIVSNIKKYLKVMSKKDEKILRTWNTEEAVSSTNHLEFHNEFVTVLNNRKTTTKVGSDFIGSNREQDS
jgi:hypothetical protein